MYFCSIQIGLLRLPLTGWGLGATNFKTDSWYGRQNYTEIVPTISGIYVLLAWHNEVTLRHYYVIFLNLLAESRFHHFFFSTEKYFINSEVSDKIKKLANIEKKKGKRQKSSICKIPREISIGNSMISSVICHKYHEWYFKSVIRNFTSR